MKIKDLLKESIDFWIPDAPRDKKTEMCWVCDGTGIDYKYVVDGILSSFYFSRHNDSIDDMFSRILENDKELKILDAEREKQERQLEFVADAKEDNQGNSKALALLTTKSENIRSELKDIIVKIKNHRKELYDELERVIKTGELKSATCDYCGGSGGVEGDKSDAPEMNVSNRNAGVILQILGIEYDYAGSIHPNQIPALKRRLLLLQNQENGLNKFTKDTEQSQSVRTQRSVDPETGLNKIEPVKGPVMIDVGLPLEQIQSYIDRLLPLLDYAQKNNMEIVWG